VTADAGYGDNTTFRLELETRGWQYVVAVKGTTSAYAADARPVTRSLGGGPGRPPKPAYPAPPANLRQLALAHPDKIAPVTWRQGTKATPGNPDALMTSHFLAIRVRPANREQIKEAIRALNFERNATALTITTDITHVAGFLAPSFDEYHGVMLEHLSRALRRDGRALLIYRHGADTRLMEDVSNTSPPSGSTR